MDMELLTLLGGERRAEVLLASCKHNGHARGACGVASALPSPTITLTLGNNRISKMSLSNTPVLMVLQKP